MRTAIIVSRNYAYSWVIHELIRQRSTDTFSIFETDFLIKGKGTAASAMYLIQQGCLSYLAVRSLESIAISLLSRPPFVWVNPHLRACNLDWVCRHHQLEAWKTDDVCSGRSLARIRSFRPDLIISLTGQRLRQPLIDLAPRGVLNVHFGILPDYRGIAPYVWAMSHGMRNIGTSIHRIDSERMDTGPVLVERRVDVAAGCSIGGVFTLCAQAAARILPLAIRMTEAGEAQGRPQGKGSYYRWPKASTMRSIHRQGFKWFGALDITRNLADQVLEERSVDA